MTTHPAAASLLRAVLERPWDDAVRLVYADALDEAGEAARGQFIRVQCELAKVEPCRKATPLYPDNVCLPPYCLHCRPHRRPGHYRDLRVRERVLLEEYGPRWGGEAVGGPASRPSHADHCRLHFGRHGENSVLFGRGFVESVSCALDDWRLRLARPLCSRHPVARVLVVGRMPATLPDWFGMPTPFMWQHYRGRSLYLPYLIPAWLWPALVGAGGFVDRLHGPVTENLHYAAPFDALRALSHAAVAFGREAAGLPPVSR